MTNIRTKLKKKIMIKLKKLNEKLN